jgi:hypothetical protein
MLNGEMGRYRAEDLMRAGAQDRFQRSITAKRRAARNARLHRIVATAATLLPIPVKH